MDTILHNTKVWLTTDGRLEVYDPKLATRINRYVKSYANGKYTFKPGEEAVFKLSQIELNKVLSLFLFRESTQTGKP